jgi:hypothetical protein
VLVDEGVEVAEAAEGGKSNVFHAFSCSFNSFGWKIRRGGGMKGGAKVIIEAHRHEGVFIARSKEDALVTLNSTPGKIEIFT